MASADIGDQPLAAGAAAVAAVREEELRVAARTQIRTVDVLHACGVERPLGGGPEVEAAVLDDVVPETLAERRSHLLPHLVAARADAGTDDGRERAAEGAGARLDDSCQQPTPADVQGGESRRCT